MLVDDIQLCIERRKQQQQQYSIEYSKLSVFIYHSLPVIFPVIADRTVFGMASGRTIPLVSGEIKFI